MNGKFKSFLMFFLYRAIQKGNQAAGQNRARIVAYRVVQTLYIEGLHDAVRTYTSTILPRSVVSFLYSAVWRKTTKPAVI